MLFPSLRQFQIIPVILAVLHWRCHLPLLRLFALCDQTSHVQLAPTIMSSPFAMPANMDTVQSTLDQDYDVVVATTSILVALSTIAIALRVYVRTCMTKTFGKDDATMVAAWVCFMVTAGLSYVSTGVERELVDHGRLTVSTNVLVQVGGAMATLLIPIANALRRSFDIAMLHIH